MSLLVEKINVNVKTSFKFRFILKIKFNLFEMKRNLNDKPLICYKISGRDNAYSLTVLEIKSLHGLTHVQPFDSLRIHLNIKDSNKLVNHAKHFSFLIKDTPESEQ